MLEVPIEEKKMLVMVQKQDEARASKHNEATRNQPAQAFSISSVHHRWKRPYEPIMALRPVISSSGNGNDARISRHKAFTYKLSGSARLRI